MAVSPRDRQRPIIFIHLLLTLLLLNLHLPFTTAIPSPTDDNPKSTPSPSSNPEQQSPFSPTTPTQYGNGTTSYCVAGFLDCSPVGRKDACCTLTQVCTFDEGGNLGCCEFGVKCVGKIPIGKDNEGSAGRVMAGDESRRWMMGVGVGLIAVMVGWWM